MLRARMNFNKPADKLGAVIFMRSTMRIGWPFCLVLVAGVLVGCGGGDGGGNSGSVPTPPTGASPPPPNTGTPPAPPPPPVVQPPPRSSSFPETTLAFSGPAEQSAVPTITAAKLPVPAGAMVYDKSRDQLIISAALSSTSVGLVALSPANLSVLWAVATSSPATVLAISDDGSQLYAGLFYESAIQQFDLRTRSSVRKFDLGAPDPRFGAFDIAVRPGSPQTIAVSIGHRLTVPTFAQLALYVNGVRQPKTLPNDFTFGRASQIEFVDASTIVGFDNETTAYKLSTIGVVDDGLVAAGPSGQLFCCFDATLAAANGRLFVGSGAFLDSPTLKAVKRVGRGVAMMMFHPGADSVVQFQDDSETFSGSPVRFVIEEYDVERGYLKRRFRVDEALPGADTTTGRFSIQVVAAIPTGASSFAFLVFDVYSGATAILAYDLAAIAPLPSRSFSAKTVAAGNARALSIPLASYAVAYDPARDRLAAIVPPWVGPQGNSVAIIRTSDGVIEHFVPLSSEPRNISVSLTDSKAYVTLPFESSIQQVHLETGALGWKARIDFPPGATIGFVTDSIAVKPDDPHTVVIAGCGYGVVCHRNVMVFRNGQFAFDGSNIQFPQGSFPVTSAVAFNGPSDLLGFDLETTTPTLQRFLLGTSALQAVSVTPFPDVDPGVPPKAGHGFAYSRFSVVDLQTNRRAGRFAPGSTDYIFFDQTLLMSADTGVGHYQRPNSGAGEQAELYELLRKSVKPDGTLEFSGTSRIRITNTSFFGGFKGQLVQLDSTRFAQGFNALGDGVIYVVSTP
jgi:hypothetical protein